MWSRTSQAQKLSRHGMTQAHLLNLTLPWRLPFLVTGFFQPSPFLSRAVKERIGAPVTYGHRLSLSSLPRARASAGSLCLVLEFQLEAGNQASSPEKGTGQEKRLSKGGGKDQVSRQGLRIWKGN